MGSSFVYTNSVQWNGSGASQESGSGLLTPTEWQGTQMHLHSDMFMMLVEVSSASFRELNERFSDLFRKLCQRYRIDEEVYNEFSNTGGILDIMYSRKVSFQQSCFVEFVRYIRYFLTGDGSERLIFLINMLLNNFAAIYGLNG